MMPSSRKKIRHLEYPNVEANLVVKVNDISPFMHGKTCISLSSLPRWLFELNHGKHFESVDHDEEFSIETSFLHKNSSNTETDDFGLKILQTFSLASDNAEEKRESVENNSSVSASYSCTQQHHNGEKCKEVEEAEYEHDTSKDFSVFCSKELDYLLESENNELHCSANIAENHPADIIYNVPTKQSGYVKTLQDVLSKTDKTTTFPTLETSCDSLKNLTKTVKRRKRRWFGASQSHQLRSASGPIFKRIKVNVLKSMNDLYTRPPPKHPKCDSILTTISLSLAEYAVVALNLVNDYHELVPLSELAKKVFVKKERRERIVLNLDAQWKNDFFTKHKTKSQKPILTMTRNVLQNYKCLRSSRVLSMFAERNFYDLPVFLSKMERKGRWKIQLLRHKLRWKKINMGKNVLILPSTMSMKKCMVPHLQKRNEKEYSAARVRPIELKMKQNFKKGKVLTFTTNHGLKKLRKESLKKKRRMKLKSANEVVEEKNKTHMGKYTCSAVGDFCVEGLNSCAGDMMRSKVPYPLSKAPLPFYHPVTLIRVSRMNSPEEVQIKAMQCTASIFKILELDVKMSENQDDKCIAEVFDISKPGPETVSKHKSQERHNKKPKNDFTQNKSKRVKKADTKINKKRCNHYEKPKAFKLGTLGCLNSNILDGDSNVGQMKSLPLSKQTEVAYTGKPNSVWYCPPSILQSNQPPLSLRMPLFPLAATEIVKHPNITAVTPCRNITVPRISGVNMKSASAVEPCHSAFEVKPVLFLPTAKIKGSNPQKNNLNVLLQNTSAVQSNVGNTNLQSMVNGKYIQNNLMFQTHVRPPTGVMSHSQTCPTASATSQTRNCPRLLQVLPVPNNPFLNQTKGINNGIIQISRGTEQESPTTRTKTTPNSNKPLSLRLDAARNCFSQTLLKVSNAGCVPINILYQPQSACQQMFPPKTQTTFCSGGMSNAVSFVPSRNSIVTANSSATKTAHIMDVNALHATKQTGQIAPSVNAAVFDKGLIIKKDSQIANNEAKSPANGPKKDALPSKRITLTISSGGIIGKKNIVKINTELQRKFSCGLVSKNSCSVDAQLHKSEYLKEAANTGLDCLNFGKEHFSTGNSSKSDTANKPIIGKKEDVDFHMQAKDSINVSHEIQVPPWKKFKMYGRVPKIQQSDHEDSATPKESQCLDETKPKNLIPGGKTALSEAMKPDIIPKIPFIDLTLDSPLETTLNSHQTKEICDSDTSALENVKSYVGKTKLNQLGSPLYDHKILATAEAQQLTNTDFNKHVENSSPSNQIQQHQEEADVSVKNCPNSSRQAMLQSKHFNSTTAIQKPKCKELLAVLTNSDGNSSKDEEDVDDSDNSSDLEIDVMESSIDPAEILRKFVSFEKSCQLDETNNSKIKKNKISHNWPAGISHSRELDAVELNPNSEVRISEVHRVLEKERRERHRNSLLSLRNSLNDKYTPRTLKAILDQATVKCQSLLKESIALSIAYAMERERNQILRGNLKQLTGQDSNDDLLEEYDEPDVEFDQLTVASSVEVE